MKTMRKLAKHTICFLLALVLVTTGTAAVFAAGPETAAATKNTGSPYYVMVNRTASTTTVYGLDAEGFYSIPVRAMVCSTGKPGTNTPPGTFTISNRAEWMYMVDGTYGQYATRFNGAILFHSICYSRKDPSKLLTYEYNQLGTNVSRGCVRLQTADAKWVYENCPKGTKVTVYDAEDPGPLGKPGTLLPSIEDAQANGWDPTDPRPENPWRSVIGDKAGTSSAYPGMPFGDVTVKNWFYPQVLAAYRADLMQGTASGTFHPERILSFAQALQLVYNLREDKTPVQAEGAWYAPALQWAKANGIVREKDGEFRPESNIPRQMLALYLCRLKGGAAQDAQAALDPFSDADRTGLLCRDALAWAVEQGIMGGYQGKILPLSGLTRAEAAAMLSGFAGL